MPTLLTILLAFLGANATSAYAVAAPEGLKVVEARIEPLSEPAFKEFGQVVDEDTHVRPTIETAVLTYWGGLAKAQIQGPIEFGVFKLKSRDHELAEMERHNKTPVLLVSLRDDWLLVVAPPTPPRMRRAAPDAAKVRVFVVGREQGVVLKRGVWHAMPFPRGREGLYLAAFRDGTVKRDTLSRPFRNRELVRFK